MKGGHSPSRISLALAGLLLASATVSAAETSRRSFVSSETRFTYLAAFRLQATFCDTGVFSRLAFVVV